MTGTASVAVTAPPLTTTDPMVWLSVIYRGNLYLVNPADGSANQITGDGLSGRVVTLGQQLVDDGSRIAIPDDRAQASSSGDKADRK